MTPSLKISAATGKSIMSVPVAVPFFVISLSILTFFQIENDNMIRTLSDRAVVGYEKEGRLLLKAPVSTNIDGNGTEVFILTDTAPAPIHTAYAQ